MGGKTEHTGPFLPELYKTQISFTEWFSAVKHDMADALREEDNTKRDRLEILHKRMRIPYDKPVQFHALDLAEKSAIFMEYLQKHGHDLCALRLMPLQKRLPKLRTRGMTVQDAVKWFYEQKADPRDYIADFVPHSEKQTWSTIFIVNKKGLFGEIIRGGHYQLSQGFYDRGFPIIFSYDFTHWAMSIQDNQALQHLKDIIRHLNVPEDKQEILKQELSASFSSNYLCGYFETTHSEDCGLWFIDYNRLLGDRLTDMEFTVRAPKEGASGIAGWTITGISASSGKVKERVTGRARVLTAENISSAALQPGDILVTTMTTPDFLPFMQRAAAIVTDLGGILSHAAIVCRELGIPVVTGTMNATQRIKDGELIEVNTAEGIVRKVQGTA